MMNDAVARAWPINNCGTAARRWALSTTFGPIALVMFITVAVYVGTCAWPVILDETDGQYAGAAREMLSRGDWLVPTNNGVPRLQKPPLVYWLILASLKVFGVNEFAARMPNALATVAWVLTTYLIGKRIGGEQRGLIAATIHGSMTGLFLFTHRIMPEPFLATFISLTVWCLLNAQLEPLKRKWFFGAWVCMGFGVLSKGLHGALWPLLIVAVSAVLLPRTQSMWKGLLSVPGLAAFLTITIPWYVLMVNRFPGFLGFHFFNEQAGHAFNMHMPRDCQQVPLVRFWAQHLLYLFPWIFLLPAFLLMKFKVSGAGLRDALREDGGGEKLLWIWIGITALTISFSARQDHYSMTSWGAIAVCLALPLAEAWPLHRLKWLTMPAAAMIIAGCLILLAAIAVQHPGHAAATQVQPEAARDNIHSAIGGLSADAWRDCGPLAIAVGAALLTGGALAGFLIRLRRTFPATFMIAGTMAVVFALSMRGYAQMQEYFSLADAAKTINAQAAPDALIVCEGEPHLSASLFFYLNRQVSWTGAQTGSVAAAESHGIPVGPFVSDEALADAWRSDKQVFFILEESDVQKWKPRLLSGTATMSVLARDGTRVLISNQPRGEFIAGGG